VVAPAGSNPFRVRAIRFRACVRREFVHLGGALPSARGGMCGRAFLQISVTPAALLIFADWAAASPRYASSPQQSVSSAPLPLAPMK